jgi:arylsulfatase A-like enzyme
VLTTVIDLAIDLVIEATAADGSALRHKSDRPDGALPGRSARLGLVALFVVVTLFGCTRHRDATAPRGLVLVCIDTLRADHLGAYGYARATSPRIDALADDAIVFEHAVAPSPWTLPSIATLMTSLYPSVHGAHSPSDLRDLDWFYQPQEYRPFTALHPSRTTLAEVLRDAGFATYAGVQGSYPTRVFGMGQGFDVYHQNRTPGVRFDIEDALRWLDSEQPDRFFVYLHVGEVHSPYTPIEMPPGAPQMFQEKRMPYFKDAVDEERGRFAGIDFDPDYTGEVDGSRANLTELMKRGGQITKSDLDHLTALYDRGIAYTDHWIGELLDGLADRGLAEEVVFVLTADHGEEFVEHGGLEHNYTYYEEMLRIPLIIRVAEGAASRVDDLVGLVDVMPTVLDVLGVGDEARRGELQGRSLRPLWMSDAPQPAHDYLGEASFRDGDRAIRNGRWKFIQRAPRKPGRKNPRELYDLVADPGEQVNQCQNRQVECQLMSQRLAKRSHQMRATARELALPEAERAAIDESTLEHLRELGYVEAEPDEAAVSP